jgi:hypothetical protein
MAPLVRLSGVEGQETAIDASGQLNCQRVGGVLGVFVGDQGGREYKHFLLTVGYILILIG